MDDEKTPAAPQMEFLDNGTAPKCARPCWWKRLFYGVAAVALVYFVAAYIVTPLVWRRYVHKHPALDDVPGITQTASGIPGDPIDLALIGTKHDVVRALLAAKWYPADPITLKSSLEIAADTVLKRPYDDAPVSSL